MKDVEVGPIAWARVEMAVGEREWWKRIWNRAPKVKDLPTRVYRSLSDQEPRTQSLDLERHITKFPIEYRTPKHGLAIIEGGLLWF